MNLYGLSDSIQRSSSKYLVILSLAVYFAVFEVKDFKTSDLFAVSMFLKQIEDNLRSLLNTATFYSELNNCTRRIQKILLMSESQQFAIENESFDINEEKYMLKSHDAKKNMVEKITAFHSGTDIKALDNVSFKIPEGQLTGIVGPVGSGKSSIFTLLLNELDIRDGKFPKFQKFGFSPQEPWILTGTIRENILMGRKFDEKRYRQVIDVTCMAADLEKFNARDLSYIGDRGITLR